MTLRGSSAESVIFEQEPCVPAVILFEKKKKKDEKLTPGPFSYVSVNAKNVKSSDYNTQKHVPLFLRTLYFNVFIN